MRLLLFEISYSIFKLPSIENELTLTPYNYLNTLSIADYIISKFMEKNKI